MFPVPLKVDWYSSPVAEGNGTPIESFVPLRCSVEVDLGVGEVYVTMYVTIYVTISIVEVASGFRANFHRRMLQSRALQGQGRITMTVLRIKASRETYCRPPQTLSVLQLEPLFVCYSLTDP